MRVTEIDYDGPPPIDSYGAGGFRIAGAWRPGSLTLTAAGVAAWRPSALAEVSPEDFEAIVAQADGIDVLLVGVGETLAPLPRAVREALEAAGLGVEPMSTASACRTYNVLLAEGRRTAAALIAV